ncbi:MAG: glycosyltransferase, partial [Muribaculaceae bacterium]|nr:glycosyltransferase [Muribaculaceae bacterium]
LFILDNAVVFDDIRNALPEKVRLRNLHVTDNRLLLRSCQICYSLMIRILPRLGVRKHLAELFWRAMKPAYTRIEETYDIAVSYQQGFMTYYVAEKVRADRKIAWINSQLSGHGHDKKFSRKFYDRYDHVVAVCEELRIMLGESGYVDPARLTSIYDIIDERSIKDKSAEPCNIDHSRGTVIVTVARLAPEKNLQLAIEAAAIMRDRSMDFIWYIIGEGDDAGILREIISRLDLTDRVILTGSKTNPYCFMKAADIYVQTSRNEGYCLTIAEARILGRPVVSTNFPMVYDQIRDGWNGLIADMTPEDVADKIMMLIGDDNLRKSIEGNLVGERNTTS